MNTLAVRINSSFLTRTGWAIAAVLGTLLLLKLGITANQALAVALSAVVILIWSNDRANGLISGLLFFMVKPLFVRIAHAVDKNISGSGGFDLLGITPALLLAALIVWHLYSKMSSGEKLSSGRTRFLILFFSGVAFLSIFNPANSILVGFGGFERIVLPNMMVLLTASFVFSEIVQTKKFVKVMILLGLVSCAYAIGQFILGVYPWEKDWLLDVAFSESTAGWLTIGLRGVEFRIFSIFYNYMDFTFCNVLIFALAISFGKNFEGRWNTCRKIYIFLWAVVLILSLERMALLMSLVAVGVVYYFNQNKQKRKRVLWKSMFCLIAFMVTLTVATPFLKNTGAEKFVRLAELANPFAAASIQDRLIRKWTPAVETIVHNPLGVGIGYGSQTRANKVAELTDYWVEPHNELLQKTLETGIVGGIAFLLLLIAVYRDALRLSHFDSPIKRLGIGLAAATIGFWMCGMVNVPLSGSSGLLYWATAGIVLSMSEKAEKQAPHSVNKSAETADNSKS